MFFKKTFFSILIISFITLFFSCKNEKNKTLEELSKICVCTASYHYTISTNPEDSNKIEYSLTNSKLFDFGIDKKGLARNVAYLIFKDSISNPKQPIKINIVKKTKNGLVTKDKTSSYTFDQETLSNLDSTYQVLLKFSKLFIENAYKKNYDECLKLTAFNDKTKNFNKIIDDAYDTFDKGYIDTKIISIITIRNGYQIYGGILSDQNLDLFKMNFRRINDHFIITEFQF